MKARLRPSLALLATLALAVSLFLIPSGAATDLQALIDAAPAGGTVTLTENVTISTALNISKALSIDGGNYSLTYTGTGGAVNIQTNDPFTLKNLTLNATASGGRGVELYGSAPVLTVDNCTLNVNNRGIGTRGASPTAGASITVTDSTIQNSQLPNGKTYDTWATVADTRGISAWNMKQAAIDVTGSTIQGFGYCINVAGTQDDNGVIDTEGTIFTVTDSHLKGWTTFNIWGAESIYDLYNTELLGVNVATGGANSFSTIVVNDDIYDIFDQAHADKNIFFIAGGSIKNYRSPETAAAGLTESLFRIDKEGVTEVNFDQDYEKNNVFIQDTAGNCDSVFFSPIMSASAMQDYVLDMVRNTENCTALKQDGQTSLPLAPQA